jgi:hypothetical protein
MIYFTEITQAGGKASEDIIFQFFPRELPEMIPIAYKTKLNHIEYNGGFHTNQIIGIYPEPVEWEGLFYGTYKIAEKNQSAKERAFQLKQLMGRPLRCVFPVPNANIGQSGNNTGKQDAKFAGESLICVIEELGFEISDYADVKYKIKLMPHQKQEKIKPKDVSIASIAIEPDMAKAAAAGRRASQAANNKQKNAAGAGKGTQDAAKKASPVTFTEFVEQARTGGNQPIIQ